MRTRATRRAPSFTQWYESGANPLRHASEAARYFTFDALKEAFKAGELRERTKDADLNDNIFEEVDSYDKD